MSVDLSKSLKVLERLYEALPPFESQTYLQHVATAPKKDLPGEVLARAYRSNLRNRPVADATLARLFGQTGERFEYLRLLEFKIRALPLSAEDKKDRLMEGLLRMLSSLPQKAGVRAETGWNRFSWQETIQAWRAKGWRKNRRTRQEVPTIEGHPVWESPVFQSVNSEGTLELVERVILRVLGELQDPFTRAVASVAWRHAPRRVEGRRVPHKPAPLTEVFQDKSRDQIIRALKVADRKLAAAILSEPAIRLEKTTELWLEKLAGKGAP